MKGNKKILIITNYKPNLGGISLQVELLNKNLRKEKFKSKIFSTYGSLFYRIFVLFKLLFRGIKYEIFHIHACSYLGFFPIVLGVTVGKILNKKIIVTYHGGDAELFFNKYPRFVHFFLTKTDSNIVLSGFLAKIFDKHKIPYIIIPNIIEISNNQFVKRNIINPNFISIRSLREIYNISCVLRAFSIVQKKYPSATLSLLGDGPCRSELEKLAKELNLDNIKFLGKVDNEKIYKYLSQADIFLSSPIIDNQPVSILEAFNAGLLVVSSAVGGVPYIIEDGKTGLLFGSDNYNEMAEKMILAIENQEDSLKMVLNAKNEISKYSWEEIKEKLLQLY